MRESAIEAALVARIKALGGECRKVKWIGRNGAPDQLVMLPAEPSVRWCRGIEGLEHRGFDKSEFSDKRYCMKCGTQDTEARGRTIWVELKSPGEKPRPLQVREHQRMEALGQTVLVVDSLELIDKHFPLN